MADNYYSLGIDVGSTTVKTVVLSPSGETVFSCYKRHGSKVRETTLEELSEAENSCHAHVYKLTITGSAGLGLSERAHLPFVQEVESSYIAIKQYYPLTDAAIELGGEDAKIIFVTGGLEERMNGSCAGGTGAFIDQMASLLNVSLEELDALALKAEKAYPIASRCGVFAKSDIQALLNQGAKKEDVALSIFYAVADQTISGLSQGRDIAGHVLFLGGPLYFLKGLRLAFKNRLMLNDQEAYFPADAAIFVAEGAALMAKKNESPMPIEEIRKRLSLSPTSSSIVFGKPLFADEADYQSFLHAHEDFAVKKADLSTYKGDAYLGIDAGSTTTKVVLLDTNNAVLYSHYEANHGLPLEAIKREIGDIYQKATPYLHIVSSAVTGYGEALIKSAFKVEYGLVETVAHFKAARYFEPDVDFVLDIGGQDIKCFRVKNGAIDSIMLNEACSSGCGSFLQSFAAALGYDVESFSRLGLFAPHPVELGSRCTVFMNSSVKEAQRDGATIGDISAGLSRSVVKNALYKVIRVRSFDELGKKIVCQGGTFLNDAVLRSFEMEIGRPVIRPSIAGLMGAFGAALYAKEKGGASTLISPTELANFSYHSKQTVCQGCTAHCNLTILFFPNHKTFVAGNRCEKAEGKERPSEALDIYPYKRKRLLTLEPTPTSPKGVVGLPLCLVMYEQLPLWDTFFKTLGYDTLVSPFSSRELYRLGQRYIPSDTACYPAKLMHGHIAYLAEKKPTFIFYPSESYNVNEKRGDNHFNCPVVAYYGEVIRQNDMASFHIPFIDPFVDLNAPRRAVEALTSALAPYGLTKAAIHGAFQKGLASERKYRQDVINEGAHIMALARQEKKKIILLAGRPYHLDPEINHGLDELLSSLGFAVISEDSISYVSTPRTKVAVLNQWTYHARLYDAASFVSKNKDIELVQMVSFGCGIDAITSDEVRSILERKGRLYTQIKIDEISNLGAARIRLRSLKAALEEREGK